MTTRCSESALETVIEAHLLQNGHVSVSRDGFDRERAISPETVLGFVRETRPVKWAKPEALHGARTEEQILADLRTAIARTIALRKEHRSALIAAAVTGRIDVDAAR